MKHSDAAMILKLTGEVTPKIIKKAYRAACNKYHPDKGGSVEMMQAVNDAYKSLKDFVGTLDAQDDELKYGDILNEALNSVTSLTGVIIEVCSAWVWLSGDTKPHKEIIKESGFRWASKKKSWYFRPNNWRSSSRGSMSLDDIREKHGSHLIKTKQKIKIENRAA
jgi:curved DNA-binding protein CbpA